MPGEGNAGPESVFSSPPIEAFCDTNILINYLNQEWERQRGAELVEADPILIVISEQVQTEIERLVDRRKTLYLKVVEFLLEQDGRIEEYSPDEYVPKNDYRHLQDLQMEFSDDDPAEALMRLRELSSKYKQRAAALLDEHVHEVVFTAAPFLFEMSLDDVIPNSSDTAIVAGAADWSNQGGTGVLVTNDTSDIVDFRDEINEIVEDHLDTESTLHIFAPGEIELQTIERA